MGCSSRAVTENSMGPEHVCTLGVLRCCGLGGPIETNTDRNPSKELLTIELLKVLWPKSNPTMLCLFVFRQL